MTGWICWKLSVKSKYLRMHPYSYLVYSSSLNVTWYSNTACALFFYFSFFFSVCLACSVPLSLCLSHSQSFTDGWVRNHSNFVVACELNWICVCVRICMSCLLRFDEIFFATSPLWSYSSLSMPLSLSLSLPFSSVDNVVARYSLLFVFLFLIYCRTVIIVIRELCKFDDRLASMQAHYRLDVCIADRSKRGRVSSGLFCFILKRR
jgi:hypothetical protein